MNTEKQTAIEIGKTYTNSRGDKVKIMGFAKCEPIDGQKIYWSLQGDWYSENGQFVMTRPIRENDKLIGFDRYLAEGRALTENAFSEILV